MRERVIMEAILEAHQNVDNYGGTWYVCDDRFMSVVKESYFINEDGTRKVKPFISLYNTDDMFYGTHGIGHLMEYKDGEVNVVKDGDIVSRINEAYRNFEQPYGEKHIEPKTYEQVGTVGFGKTHVVEQAIINEVLRKPRALGISMASPDSVGESFNRPSHYTIRPLHSTYEFNVDEEVKKFNMISGKMEKDKTPTPISDNRKEVLRKKRKKKGKKTHRKKKKK